MAGEVGPAAESRFIQKGARMDKWVILSSLWRFTKWTSGADWVQQAKRTKDDWNRFRTACRRFNALVSETADLLRADALEGLKANEIADALLRNGLLQTQQIFNEYSRGGVICSLKIPDKFDRLVCLYPPGLQFPDLKHAIKTLSAKTSIAGRSLTDRRTIFVPSFSRCTDEGLKPKGEVRDACDKYGIRGVVAGPIFLKMQDEQPRAAAVCLKIDVLTENGLVENAPTKMLFEMVAEVFGTILQFSTAIGGVMKIREDIDRPENKAIE